MGGENQPNISYASALHYQKTYGKGLENGASRATRRDEGLVRSAGIRLMSVDRIQKRCEAQQTSKLWDHLIRFCCDKITSITKLLSLPRQPSQLGQPGFRRYDQ